MPLDFASVKTRADVLEWASRFTVLKGANGPCPICSKTTGDGGTDRFHVDQKRQIWGCRQCGNGGDVIDLVSKVQGVGHRQAAEYILGGKVPRVARTIQPRPRATQPAAWQCPDWQASVKRIIQECNHSLEQTVEGRIYLASRGIGMGTAKAFCMGFHLAKRDPVDGSPRPALLLPWQDGDGVVTALKYRFVDHLATVNHGRRFTQHKGSQAHLYGLHLLRGGGPLRALVLVEGELNAASIYQATRGAGIDVLSVGPEGNAAEASKLLRGLLTRYEYLRLLAWLDDPAKASAFAASLDGCLWVSSPEGADANDMLRTGGEAQLDQYIREAMRPLCPFTPWPCQSEVESSIATEEPIIEDDPPSLDQGENGPKRYASIPPRSTETAPAVGKAWTMPGLDLCNPRTNREGYMRMVIRDKLRALAWCDIERESDKDRLNHLMTSEFILERHGPPSVLQEWWTEHFAELMEIQSRVEPRALAR